MTKNELKNEIEYAAMKEKCAAIDQRVLLRGIFREIGLATMEFCAEIDEKVIGR